MPSVGKVDPFNPSSDDIETWLEVVESYLKANGIDKNKSADADKAQATLLALVGMSAYSVLIDLFAPDKPSGMTFGEIATKLKEHYKPAPKAIAERFRFASRKQKVGESVNEFLADLRKIASKCKFSDLEFRLRDQFIFGLCSAEAQKLLFTKSDDVKLSDVVGIANAQEKAEASTLLVRQGHAEFSTPAPLDESTKKIWRKGKQDRGNSSQHQKPKAEQKSKQNLSDVKCFNCHQKGHYAKFCKSKKREGQGSSKQVQSVKSVRKFTNPIMIKVKVNGHDHDMEVDTASGPSFLSLDFWREIGKPRLKPSRQTFQTFTGQKFQSKGLLSVELDYFNQVKVVELEVSEGSSLFGRNLLNMFQIDWVNIKNQCSQVKQVSVQSELQSLKAEFADVFDKPASLIRNFKAKLILKNDATPRFFKARPVPFAIRHRVDAELERMEKAGVITRVEHSEWASPLVVVPKPDGRIRITGDFKKTVNSQLCVNQYPLSRVEDLLETVAGGLTFSKLDATDAYHQVEVEESCKKFLVVNTHRGLYQYNVLPQGIASSPAIFQELVDKMLKDIPKTGSFIDDIISTGRDDREHLDTLRKIFTRMREFNFCLASKKCEYLKSSVKFLGKYVSADGIRTDPSKVEAIMSMPVPRNPGEIKSFLGMVNFYNKFIPDMSTCCEPLNRLTREIVKWNWTKECKSAFDKIKNIVSSSTVLAHFQQELPVGISCDASKVGLGVVLFHKYPDGSERPIAFASKTLSCAERNYSQIDREGLSIVWGVKKFFQYLYGRRFTLVTDHQPLVSIFGEKTNLPSLCATRLHRWSLFLSGFSFDVVYRNTTQHGNADVLSRLPLQDRRPADKPADRVVKRIMESNPVTSKLVKFRTSRDKVLSQVCRYIRSGWPRQASEVPEEIRPYFAHRTELSIEEGIIMWGIRVVVPASLKSSVLSQLHDTHPGMVRMKSIARQYVWWPGIDKDIESTVKSCVECAKHRDNPAVAPLHPWTFPEKPWQRLHMDLAGPFLNSMWLIIVDAHSKWPEIYKLNSDSTSASVISCVREVFSRFGIPETIVSDNGRQFVSDEFETFCTNNGVRHTTSSAYHPRSNGEAERFIRSFKSAMMKKGKANTNLFLCDFLLTYRVTPHATTGVAPAESLLKSKPRTLMDLIRPSPSSRVRTKQELQVEAASGNTPCREFSPGSSVWVQTFSKDKPKWSMGTVIRAVGPVSYDVQVGERIMKRHVDHILSAEVAQFKNSTTNESPVTGPTTTPRAEPEPQQPSTSKATTPEFRSADPSPRRSPVVPIPIVIPEDDLDTSTSTSRYPQRTRKAPERLAYEFD